MYSSHPSPTRPAGRFALPRGIHPALLLTIVLLLLARAGSPHADTIPGFVDEQVVHGLVRPTAMAFAPDGRLFVCEQGGRLRVIRNGLLLPDPFVILPVDSAGERGLLGVAIDPNFTANQLVYVYYTTAASPARNRISRFIADGDAARPGSEEVVLELDDLGPSTNHNGGAIHFDRAGFLLVATGDNANPANAQSLGNRLGKILRIAPDGDIPLDNPFFGLAQGANRAILSLGLRNPFTFAVQPGTGRVFINDVGQNTWEEINEGRPGANYGWPATEGPTTDPRFDAPIFAYPHGAGTMRGCAITGAAFYNPDFLQFPPDYEGDYFFGDLCNNWIRRLDPLDGSVSLFATDAHGPVDLDVGPDGSLYYLSIGEGTVHRLAFAARQPATILSHPQSVSAVPGRSSGFRVVASGAPPLRYQWQRDGADIPGATDARYTLPRVTAADKGARFRVVVSNAFGTAVSNEATLVLTGGSNTPPEGRITRPAESLKYGAGETIRYAGTARDREDGALPPGAFTWQVDLHTPGEVAAVLPPTAGAKVGAFTVPGQAAREDGFLRVTLTVRDSLGVEHVSTRDLRPRVVPVRFATGPAGLQLIVDGEARTTPFQLSRVAGSTLQVEAPSPQPVRGSVYDFLAWSDRRPAAHAFTVPPRGGALTARFRRRP